MGEKKRKGKLERKLRPLRLSKKRIERKPLCAHYFPLLFDFFLR